MACLSNPTYLRRSLSPFKSLFPSARPSRSPLRRLLASSSSSSSVAVAMAGVAYVEHAVLFKIRESTEQSKIDAMVSNLRSLASLDMVAYLSAGPILRHRSADASASGFTHVLHSRYRSKDDLAAYTDHPAHVAVVKEHGLPICEDIMAVDWVEYLDGPLVALPGSAVRLTLAKPKEGAATELLETLAVVKTSAPEAARQVSFGENFSPERAKGYGVGLLAMFPSVEELDAMDAGQKSLVDSVKEKVRPLLQNFIVVDFEVSPPPAGSC